MQQGKGLAERANTQGGGYEAAPQSAATSGIKAVQKFIGDNQDKLANLLPIGKSEADRVRSIQMLSRSISCEMETNKNLAACSKDSILTAMMMCARLDMYPFQSFGHCYIIPYGKEAQFQLGYKGALDLARRSGAVAAVNTGFITDLDEFTETAIFDPKADINIVRDKKTGERGTPIIYWAHIELKEGGNLSSVKSKGEIIKHAQQFSQNYGSSGSKNPWKNSFDSMAMKTVLLDALKLAPQSADAQRGISLEQSYVTGAPTGLEAEAKHGPVTIDVEPVVEEPVETPPEPPKEQKKKKTPSKKPVPKPEPGYIDADPVEGAQPRPTKAEATAWIGAMPKDDAIVEILAEEKNQGLPDGTAETISLAVNGKKLNALKASESVAVYLRICYPEDYTDKKDG